MEVICDTDLLSALAKTEKLSLLEKAFPKKDFLISDYVYNELQRAKEEGYTFPDRILRFVDVTTFDEKEVRFYEKERSLRKYFPLSNSDLASLIIARRRDMILLSNDKQLLRKAESVGVLALDLYDILRILYVNHCLGKKEINELLDKIERKDNTLFRYRERIF